jgi:bifunctional non-homologous end joining protein LigD
VRILAIFVIQEHWARAHHFDFRLEREGVLKSWAVPKGIPEVTGVKRLAIPVDDHALDYATFEGILPEGQYGAGRVEIWENGTFETKAWADNRIEIDLHGEHGKINGLYVMIKTKIGFLIFKRQNP